MSFLSNRCSAAVRNGCVYWRCARLDDNTGAACNGRFPNGNPDIRTRELSRPQRLDKPSVFFMGAISQTEAQCRVEMNDGV
jgi:hypothetical protein